MDEKDRDLLIRAYKAEKDHLIGNRIHAVCMVKINGLKYPRSPRCATATRAPSPAGFGALKRRNLQA